jgi:hypothetical protein
MRELNYIIESYINGNITLSKGYILKINVNGIDIINSCECFGIETAVTILKKLDVSDLVILNAFHDYNRVNFDIVNDLLNNIKYNNYERY